MAHLRHLFVMDSAENLNLKLDSSLRLAQALILAGHECYMTTIDGISWSYSDKQQSLQILAQQLLGSTVDTPTIGNSLTLNAATIDAVYMRKDPPFDMSYLSCTWLLSALSSHAKVYNNPQAIRDKNEKLIILDYPQYIQPALVSTRSQNILDFIKSHCAGDAIIKPLDLFGGRGVERVTLDDMTANNAMDKINNLTDNQRSLRIIQPFDKSIHKGEVRVFTAGGKIISWCLKVPASGEYLANTRMGAKILAYQPSPSEVNMILDVSQDLLKKGIFLVGYDLIGGKISEINITSPRLLLPNNIDSSPYYKSIASILTQDLIH